MTTSLSVLISPLDAVTLKLPAVLSMRPSSCTSPPATIEIEPVATISCKACISPVPVPVVVKVIVPPVIACLPWRSILVPDIVESPLTVDTLPASICPLVAIIVKFPSITETFPHSWTYPVITSSEPPTVTIPPVTGAIVPIVANTWSE